MGTTASQPLNPQVIGQTESALGALLGSVLAEASTIHEVTSGLFDFPAEDLATAGRVLATVTARANAFLADHAVR